MIQSSKHNGIDFSGNFARNSRNYNFDNQRKKNVLSKAGFKYLLFEVDYSTGIDTAKLYIIGKSGIVELTSTTTEIIGTTKANFYFEIATANLTENDTIYFKFAYNGEFIFSEIYDVKSSEFITENGICYLTATNNDNRHGYLTNQAFGFFKFSEFKGDVFLSKTTEYKYSYSRSKILSSENQIAKRFTFLDLTMYNANLLKWLCKCENLTINGISYQLISEFTEVEADPNSEILNLQADFVEVNQSFFANGVDIPPVNVFPTGFFN